MRIIVRFFSAVISFAIGATGLIGYLFHYPSLYFWNRELGVGMALETAICITLLGFSVLLNVEKDLVEHFRKKYGK